MIGLALSSPTEPETPDDWRLYANCIGLDQEIFYPQRGESTRPAKAICAGCEVRLDCLEDAIARREPYGVWGGKSTEERRILLRRVKEAGIEIEKSESYRLH